MDEPASAGLILCAELKMHRVLSGNEIAPIKEAGILEDFHDTVRKTLCAKWIFVRFQVDSDSPGMRGGMGRLTADRSCGIDAAIVLDLVLQPGRLDRLKGL